MKTKLFLLLLLASHLRADLLVSGGYMVVSGGTVRVTTQTTVQSGATLQLDAGSELITPLLEILSNALLRGCDIVTGNVDNQGDILADCGTGETLQIDGNLTHDGNIQAKNDTGFAVSGSVENNGLIDLIFSPSTPPAGMTGTGEVVTADTLPAIELRPDIQRLRLPVYKGHSYQIQYTDNLAADPVVWTNDGAPYPATETSTQFRVITLPASGSRVFRYVME